MYRVIYWPKNALCIAGHWAEEALVVCVCVSSVAMGNLFIGQSKSGPGPRGVHRSNQMSLESTSVWYDQAVDVIESQPHRQGNEACVSHSLRVANWEICVHTRSGWLDHFYLRHALRLYRWWLLLLLLWTRRFLISETPICPPTPATPSPS